MGIKNLLKLLVLLPKTLYFNFHYLPFKHAIKLPIFFLSDVRLISLKGSIVINTPIHTGMVRFGGGNNPLYLQTNYKCVWANYGGDVTFSDKVHFSKGVAIEIGNNASLYLGENTYFGALSKIACYQDIHVEDNSRFSWENIIMDTDFHSTINIHDGSRSQMCKPIKIGKNNWMGVQVMIMKGTVTPDYCIASARTLLNKAYALPPYSLIGGLPAKFLKEGIYRDLKSHVNQSEQKKIDEKIKL